MKCTSCETELVGKFYQAERRRYYTPRSKSGVGYESYLPVDKDGQGILLCVPCMDKGINWEDFEVTPSHIEYDVEDRQGLYLPPRPQKVEEYEHCAHKVAYGTYCTKHSRKEKENEV